MSIENIEFFLRQADMSFPIPISKKQDLHSYAVKLYEKATIFASWRDGRIVSMAAGYTNDLENDMAYIALVATLEQARGQGLAGRLVQQFLDCCAEKKIGSVHLYASPGNDAALRLYEKLGFSMLKLENEPRPADIHLIYYLEK